LTLEITVKSSCFSGFQKTQK